MLISKSFQLVRIQMLFFVSQATFIKKSFAKENEFSQSPSHVHFKGVKVYLKFWFVAGTDAVPLVEEFPLDADELPLEEAIPELEEAVDDEVPLDDEDEDPLEEDEEEEDDPLDEEALEVPLAAAAAPLATAVVVGSAMFKGLGVVITIVKFRGTAVVLLLEVLEWVKLVQVWFVFVVLAVWFAV